jgi:hypothetical protein
MIYPVAEAAKEPVLIDMGAFVLQSTAQLVYSRKVKDLIRVRGT